jgi:hypothetical protein
MKQKALHLRNREKVDKNPHHAQAEEEIKTQEICVN